MTTMDVVAISFSVVAISVALVEVLRAVSHQKKPKPKVVSKPKAKGHAPRANKIKR